MRKLPRDTMTARQRIEATLRGELPDRVHIFDLVKSVGRTKTFCPAFLPSMGEGGKGISFSAPGMGEEKGKA